MVKMVHSGEESRHRTRRVPSAREIDRSRRAVLEAWLGKLPVKLFLVMTTAYALCVSLPFATYLNKHVFLNQVHRLRAALDLQPVLSDEVVVVVAEDLTAKRLGRTIRLEEWSQIARLLGTGGVETTIVAGLFPFDSDVGAEAGTEVPRMIGAVAFMPGDRQSGAERDERLEARALPLPAGVTGAGELFSRWLPMSDKALPYFAQLGALNYRDDDVVETLYVHATGGVAVPQISLWAAAGLEAGASGLSSQRGTIPVSPDGTIGVDYVTVGSLKARAIPAGKFFVDGVVRTSLPEGFSKHFGRPRLALIAPAGQTGSRSVNTPVAGLLPSYFLVASLVASAMRHTFLHVPASDALLLGFWTLGAWICLAWTRRRTAIIVTTLVVVASPIIAAILLHELGWILPVVPASFIVLAGITMRSFDEYVRTSRFEAALSQQLALGREVQALLLPDTWRGRIDAFEYRIGYWPHGAMAGDWAFVSPPSADDRGVGVIAIGDVVGKGPSAALATAAIASVFNLHIGAFKGGELSPQEFLLHLNNALYRTFRGRQYTTLSLAVLRGGEASLFTMGAPVWIHLRADKTSARINAPRASDPPGLRDNDLRFLPMSVSLSPGDVLFACTDGVMETGPSFRNFMRRMDAADLSGDFGTVFETIAGAADDSGHASVLSDDRTLIVLRYAPVAAARDDGNLVPPNLELIGHGAASQAS